jgi:predicted permease
MPDTALIRSEESFAERPMARVTRGVFDLLGGVRPVRGRLFEAPEGEPGAEDRALIREDLWREWFHGDPAVVGSYINVNDRRVLVVGVLPEHFRFPTWNTAIWLPVDFSSSSATQSARVIVRFAPGVPSQDALRLATDAARSADSTAAHLFAVRRPLTGLVVDPYYQRAVPVLSGAAILVFLALIANVCSLLMSRLTERRREFAMCAALGAAPEHLARQVVIETAVMAALGVAGGVGLAWCFIITARSFLPEAFLLRTLNPLQLDWRTLVMAVSSGALAMLLTAWLPAWSAGRVEIDETLRVSRGGTEGPRARTFARLLLVGEIAFACVLLFTASVLIRSFVKLASADRGLDPDRIVTATMTLPRMRLPDKAARENAAKQIEAAVRPLPGVRELAWTFGLPPDTASISFGDWHPDTPAARSVNLTLDRYNVGPDFFDLYGIPLLRGRIFEPQDDDGATIVGARLARIFWGDLDPLGRTFYFENETFHVIGVAGDIHFPAVDQRLDRPQMYQPFRGVTSYAMLSVRCAPCPAPAMIRYQVSKGSPFVQVVKVRPLAAAYLEQLSQPRAAAALATTFGVVSGLSAAAGLFSVFTLAVARRMKELGIRAAIGASPGRLRRLVLKDGAYVALAGLALGGLGAVLAARVIQSLQYNITGADPISLAFVLVSILLVVIAATWRPAQRAARVDPALLLREQ